MAASQVTYGTIVHWNEVGPGARFSTCEQPKLLTVELRTAFRPPR
ncbi:hypothetical protein AB0D49_29075 [Streptomyces sp. NPDC048290]